jgi:hypothetical protein
LCSRSRGGEEGRQQERSDASGNHEREDWLPPAKRQVAGR